jgi:hypothetical protein
MVWTRCKNRGERYRGRDLKEIPTDLGRRATEYFEGRGIELKEVRAVYKSSGP